MTTETWIGAASRRRLVLLLAAVSLAGVAACGGEERLSREEFSDHVQTMDRRESARYAGLAQHARRLEPDEPLTAELKQGLTEYAVALQRAADELEELSPPEDAEEGTAALIEALRERADAFEHAATTEGVTLAELEAEGSATRAGDEIDRAFEQLRAAGFLGD